MNTASNDIVTSLHAIRDAVGEISESSAAVGATVEEQAATTNNIADSVQSAAESTRTFSDSLEDIRRGVGDSESASKHVLEAAQRLSNQAESLDMEVKRFLGEMRSGAAAA